MGIRIKNLQNILIDLQVSKEPTASATIPIATRLVPFDGYISNITAGCGTAGTGVTNSVLDIHLAGTTIFATATKITLASTTGVASYSALTTQPTQVTAGQTLCLYADTVSTSLTCPVACICISRSQVDIMSTLSDQRAAL